VSLLSEYADTLQRMTSLMVQQTAHINAMEEERAGFLRQTEILKQLIEIVDPELWQGGQADMHELVSQVRVLKNGVVQ
jgi:hypothetical protein